MYKEFIDAYIGRMMEVYKKSRNLIIAYDFDDTVNPTHAYSYPYVERAVELLKKAGKRKDLRFILVTCREGEKLTEAECTLIMLGLPYNSINQNLPFSIADDPRKIYCNLMLDDKAGLPLSCDILEELLKKLP